MGKMICCALTILMLALFKPTAPVWIGVGLLTLVVMSARYNLSAPSPRYRRAATRRMGLLTVFGLGLILFGAHVTSPWCMCARSPEEARCLMLSLTLYCTAILGAPTAAWAYMSYPRYRRNRITIQKSQCTLPGLARHSSRTQVRIAV